MTLFAGDPTSQGQLDGPGVDALFSLPSAVAVDNNGFVWIADTGNNAVRKISSGGVVSTVAGGVQGYTEGSGAAARFDTPSGIAVDVAGNVFVLDTGNNRVRKITAGTTTTQLLIGGGGAGTANSLSSPNGLTCDRNGNLYIADTGNFRILRVAAGASSATVFAGSGTPGLTDATGAAAQFISPVSVTVDYTGNLYVADGAQMRKITPAGVVTSVDVSGVAFTQLRLATDRTGDGTVIYAADADNHRIYTLKRESATTYAATGLAGAGVAGYLNGLGNSAFFRSPGQLSVTSTGTIFVPDTGNHVIRKLL